MKLNIKSLSEVFKAVREYLFPYEKIQKKFYNINNRNDLKKFVKERSAFVTQTTLYGYLKTRMGLKYTMMFSDEIFLESINKSKWNIFAISVSDLTLYTFSYLISLKNKNPNNIEEFYDEILENEKESGMPSDLIEKYKNIFRQTLKEINISNYYQAKPFEASGQALYNWSPIADELKVLDKEIVLNSIKNKWMLVMKDFQDLIKNFN